MDKNHLGVTFFILTAILHHSYSTFVKFGPCLFAWNVTCPDPHINFYLFTKKTKNTPEKVASDKESIMKSNFNPKHENKIIIHGYSSDMNLTQLLEMKDGYLQIGNYNVWMVDWKTVAAGPCYPVVVGSMNYVGACTAQLIKELSSLIRAPPPKVFHVIGFSLGAQVAAYTANNLRPYKLPRITGLDPALPLFTTTNPDKKLDKTDADFVDVLHTDALVEGKAERCGHIDFYMNGGLEQPGCWNRNILEAFKCNHQRAPSYFAESITSKAGFWGWPCKSFFHYLVKQCPPKIPDVLMGEYCNQNATGYYIVHTAAKKPFAIGRNFISPISAQLITAVENISIPVPLMVENRTVERIKLNSFFPDIELE